MQKLPKPLSFALAMLGMWAVLSLFMNLMNRDDDLPPPPPVPQSLQPPRTPQTP